MSIDHDKAMRDGYTTLIDELPAELAADEKPAYAIGYLYAFTNQLCPNAIRHIPDHILGDIYEVDEGDTEKKIGYVIPKSPSRTVPIRIYER
jgi:hypothetical protein